WSIRNAREGSFPPIFLSCRGIVVVEVAAWVPTTLRFFLSFLFSNVHFLFGRFPIALNVWRRDIGSIILGFFSGWRLQKTAEGQGLRSAINIDGRRPSRDRFRLRLRNLNRRRGRRVQGQRLEGDLFLWRSRLLSANWDACTR